MRKKNNLLLKYENKAIVAILVFAMWLSITLSLFLISDIYGFANIVYNAVEALFTLIAIALISAFGKKNE